MSTKQFTIVHHYTNFPTDTVNYGSLTLEQASDILDYVLETSTFYDFKVEDGPDACTVHIYYRS